MATTTRSDAGSKPAHLGTWRLAALVWAACIFSLSTETFGGSRTRLWLAALAASVHGHLPDPALDILNEVVRKLAHLTEYSVFSFLIYRSLGGALRIRWSPRLAGWAVLCAAAYSLSDELHQVVVPGRTASLIDCGIDSTGALLAMFLVYGSSAFSSWNSKTEAARPLLDQD